MKRPRRPRPMLPPPGMRPKLPRDQVVALGLAHHANVEAIRTGAGTPAILQQFLGGAFTWHLVAQHMAHHQPEQLAEPLRVMEALIVAGKDLAARFRATGRITFTGPELQVAVEAVGWMDALAEQVDTRIAVAAAVHSDKMLRALEPAAETETA